MKLYTPFLLLLWLASSCIGDTREASDNNAGDQSSGTSRNDTVRQVAIGPDEAAGKQIFEVNCTSCHAVHKKLIGPPLAGVNDRHSREWLHSFIRNSQKMIKEKDPVAVKLWEDNHKLVMNSFENLTEEQIDQVLAYIAWETKKDAP